MDSAEKHVEVIWNERMKNSAPIKPFSHSLKIREPLYVSSYTEEDLTNTWHSICDIARKKREEKQALALLKSSAYQGVPTNKVEGRNRTKRVGPLSRIFRVRSTQ
jgi:hypothetical protein